MKKAAKILFIVLTIVSGVSLISSIVVLAMMGLFSIGAGTMELVLGIIALTHKSDSTTNLVIVYFLEAGMFYLLAFVMTPILMITVGARAGAQFVLMLVGGLRVSKAETKKQTIFPMVVSFVFAGLYLVNGSYLYTALYALPGIFLAVSKDEVKPAQVEVQQ